MSNNKEDIIDRINLGMIDELDREEQSRLAQKLMDDTGVDNLRSSEDQRDEPRLFTTGPDTIRNMAERDIIRRAILKRRLNDIGEADSTEELLTELNKNMLIITSLLAKIADQDSISTGLIEEQLDAFESGSTGPLEDTNI